MGQKQSNTIGEFQSPDIQQKSNFTPGSGVSFNQSAVRSPTYFHQTILLADSPERNKSVIETPEKGVDSEKKQSINNRMPREGKEIFSNFFSTPLKNQMLFSVGSIEFHKCLLLSTTSYQTVKISKVNNLIDTAEMSKVKKEPQYFYTCDNPMCIKVNLIYKDVEQIYSIHELIDCNLKQVLEERKETLSSLEISVIMYQIISFLNKMHSAKYVFVNVILENIGFLDRNNLATLKFLSSRELFNTSSGKNSENTNYDDMIQYAPPQYFSPNQTITAEADFWSAGVLLFYLLYKEFPYMDGKPHEDLKKFISDRMKDNFPLHFPKIHESYKFCKDLCKTLLKKDSNKFDSKTDISQYIVELRSQFNIYLKEKVVSSIQKDSKCVFENYKSMLTCVLKAASFDNLKKIIFSKIGLLFLPPATRIQFHNLFVICDENYSGIVTKAELKNGIHVIFNSYSLYNQLENISTDFSIPFPSNINYNAFMYGALLYYMNYSNPNSLLPLTIYEFIKGVNYKTEYCIRRV